MRGIAVMVDPLDPARWELPCFNMFRCHSLFPSAGNYRVIALGPKDSATNKYEWAGDYPEQYPYVIIFFIILVAHSGFNASEDHCFYIGPRSTGQQPGNLVINSLAIFT
jgi:hypothetical protein